jgi:integrase
MATIRKREGARGVRWQSIVRRGGQRLSRAFGTKREATEWAAAVETAINRDEFVGTTEARRRTIEQMLERYRGGALPGKADARNQHRHLDYWIERIGHLKIASVTRAQIIEERDLLAENRKPGTVNRYLATLRQAFRTAMLDWEWANRNPCQKIALREPTGRDRHLSDPEIEALLDATSTSEHPHLHAAVLIAVTTGARRGEVMGLRWRDVDLARGRAVLHKTKNREKRTLVLVPEVVEALRQMQQVRRIDDDRIFPPANADGRRTYPTFEDAWREALRTAGISDFRFHDLRHTFASRLAMDGASLTEIAAALGHKTLAMVQRYAHLTEAHVHDVAARTARGILSK